MKRRKKIDDQFYFKCIRLVKLIFWIIFGVSIIITMLLQGIGGEDAPLFNKNEIKQIQGWQIETQDQLTSIKIPEHIKWKAKEPMTIVNTVPQVNSDRYSFYICGVMQDIDVYINGEERMHYVNRNSRFFGNHTPSAYVQVQICPEDSGKQIKIVYCTASKVNSGCISNILIGTNGGFIYFMLRNYGHMALTAMLLVIVGVVFIFFSIVINLVYGKKQGMHYLGAFPVIVGTSIFSGSYVRQFYTTNLPAASNMAYIGIQICVIPLICFLDELQQYRHKKYYMRLKALFLLNFFVCFFLQFFDIADYAQTLYSTYFLISCTGVVIAYTYYCDLKIEKRTEIVESLVALLSIAVFGCLEILNFNIKNNPIWGQYISIGVLMFLIIMSFTTINQMQRREHETYKAIEANEAKTIFLANMSHEIRTPLNVMLGMNEMILRESNSEELTGYAESIHESGRALLYLINNILDLSKIESGKMEIVKHEFDLRSLLDNLCGVGKVRNRNDEVEFLTIVNPDLPRKIVSDEQHIRQIVINFLSNGMKYTQKGSVSLIVDFEPVDEKNMIILFAVKDTGMGIKPKDQEVLFEAFTRVDVVKNQKIEGTGLGLSIAKQLAQLMQGQITVQSEYGVGSEFCFKVPVEIFTEEKLGEYEPNNKASKRYKIEHGFIAPEARILAVDDSNMNLDVIRGLLKRTGMEIDTAESGEECLLKMSQKKYHVILLDHMMPGMDGVETVRRAKQMTDNLNKDTPIIAVTANAVTGAREMFIQNGFADFVPKPIAWKELEEILKKNLPKELVYNSESHELDVQWKEDKIEYLCKRLKEYDIQMQEGMRYTGDDIYQYARFLELYYHAYPKIKGELEENCKEKTLDFYTVKVHALKGNAKSMGALDLFYTAQRMENRGKQGDFEYCRKAQYLLLLEMERAREGARMFLDETQLWEEKQIIEHATGKVLSEEELEQVVKKLIEYMEELQSGEAKKLVRATRTNQLNEKTQQVFTKVENLLDDMEYEKAEEMLKKLIHMD